MRPATSTPRTLAATAALLAALTLTAATGCTTTPTDTDNTPTSSTSTGPPPGARPDPDRSPQEPTMTTPQSQADREAIIANYQARQHAMIDADTDALRDLSTPDSHAGHISGYNQPRDEWFDQIASGYFDYHTIDTHSINVTATGLGTATLVARSTIDVTIGGTRNTWRLESTTDYVKQDGHWLSGDGSTRTY